MVRHKSPSPQNLYGILLPALVMCCKGAAKDAVILPIRGGLTFLSGAVSFTECYHHCLTRFQSRWWRTLGCKHPSGHVCVQLLCGPGCMLSADTRCRVPRCTPLVRNRGALSAVPFYNCRSVSAGARGGLFVVARELHSINFRLKSLFKCAYQDFCDQHSTEIRSAPLDRAAYTQIMSDQFDKRYFADRQ